MSRTKTSTVKLRQSASSIMGTYNVPYKSEAVLKGLTIGVFSAIAILLLLIAGKFVHTNYVNDSSDTFMLLAVAVVLIVAEAVVVALGAVVLKSVYGGYKCRYIADEERFITTEGDNHREVYYWEVKDVRFEPITSFGKVRGYEVTVITEHKNEVHRVVSGGFISKESTPFQLLLERVDQYRSKKAHAAYMEEVRAINSAPLSLNPNNQDDPSNRLGMDAEMPSVGLPKN